MKIASLLNSDYKLLTNQEGISIDFEGCYVSDLLSNVLKQAKSENGLITTLSNMNVIAVASLLTLPFVLFCEGKLPSEEMIQKADEEGIALLTTTELAIDAILRFHSLGAL